MPCVGGTQPERPAHATPVRWCRHHPFTLAGITMFIGLAVGWILGGP